jgi:hypothetical protein
MNDHDAKLLRSWLEAAEARGSEAGLQRALAATALERQRPAWLVAVRGGTIDDVPAQGRLAWLLAASVALLATLLAIALVGGSIVRPPDPSPAPTDPAKTIAPTFEGRGGLVAFTNVTVLERGDDCPDRVTLQCYPQRAWIANANGSDAQELLPDVPERQVVVAWSPDSRRLLLELNGRPALTDPLGRAPEQFDVNGADFAFAPDGQRLVFVETFDIDNERAGFVLATLDLASGIVSRLETTRTDGNGLGLPSWSPDGQWLVFESQGEDLLGLRQSRLFLVRPDGRDLRQLTQDSLMAIDPEWAPDGSTIVFTSAVPENDENEPFVLDVFTLALDARSAVRVTSDGISARPSWTLDGRIVFAKLTQGEEPSGFELWVVNADGSAATRLDASSLAALSEIGCRSCIYPPSPPASELAFHDEAVWQPVP